jgi:hypothetical protein
MIELYKEACEFAYNVCKEEGRAGGSSDHIWNTLSTGRFAELIVRECARIADIADENKCEWIGGNILTHFGVEE